ncbi:FAD-dependent oxidoreductase [Crateriforma conspicua]|uniref:Xanthan lyase n=1 Tax=Crateriforma conspicua TaxID=2527996 RepID=A0A5C6FNV1_9PLAN|nr:FAD-dependent oxidoreductase [Crateriforma conspicua]TWU64802.1 Xanthan lyase precursor [Crateriforma conspicua]
MTVRQAFTIALMVICVHPVFAADADANQTQGKDQDRPVRVRRDLVIYGGTSAAISAAVQAKRDGLSVVVVSPDKHLGGLTSGGLGWTDTGNKAVIGGIAREFYARVYDHYQTDQAWQWQPRSDYGNRGQGTPAIDGDRRTMWIFEPHVAEAIFDSWVDENQIDVHRDRWLDRDNGVTVVDGRITQFTTLDGSVYQGKMFIDATYEGDLMAAAGVSYHVGRESMDTYGELWNGIQTGVYHHRHHFKAIDSPIDPYVVPGDPSSGVIAKVSDDPPGEYGAADHRIQAYCFRMCLTDHPDNRVPFAKPDGYDPADYELLGRIYEAGWTDTFRKFDPIPNRKTDTNNHGPMSTDNIGMNYEYPEASYQRRREIIAEHERYQKGWLYFICTDPRVPQTTRDRMNQWGLAADEFQDNGNWPHQIYVREARRMMGEMVMTENHLLKRTETPYSVGMGSYAMDSHNVQRYVDDNGHVQNEGDIGVSTRGPYQIAYQALVPKKAECENLLVPVCVSSSHIAFGSIRMEPVFMILGQSASTAAAIAIDRGVAVQEIPYAELRQKLLDDEQVLETPADVLDAVSDRSQSIPVKSINGLVVDNTKAQTTGSWQSSHSAPNHVGYDYLHDGNAGDGKSTATFTITVDDGGEYELRLAYTPHSNRATNVPVLIRWEGNQVVATVNQKESPTLDGCFVSLGKYSLSTGQSVTVRISNQGTDGHVIADAVALVPLVSAKP